jgi:hypothetical protein
MAVFSAKINLEFTSNLKKATKNLDKSTKKMSKSFEKLSDKMKKVGSRAKEVFSNIGKFAKPAAVGIGIFTAAVAGASATVFKFVKSVAGVGQELLNASEQTGLSVKRIQQLRHAAKVAQVPQEALDDAIKDFSRTISFAKAGNQAYIDKLKLMGIDAKRAGFQQASLNDLLLESADNFAKSDKNSGRATAAMENYGESGRKLIPLLIKGSGWINETGKKAATMSEETAKKGVKFNQAFIKITESVKGLAFAFSDELLPDMTNFIEMMAKNLGPGGKWNKMILVLGEKVIPIIKDALKGVEVVLEAIIPKINQFIKAYGNFVEETSSFVADVETKGVGKAIENQSKRAAEGLKPFAELLERAFDKSFIGTGKGETLEEATRMREMLKNIEDLREERKQSLDVSMTIDSQGRTRIDNVRSSSELNFNADLGFMVPA